MKLCSFIVLYLFATCCVLAQTIVAPSGQYTSSNGFYTVDIKFVDKTIVVTEPNKVSEYVMTSPNVYEFTNPTNGKHYKIEIGDETTLIAHGSTGTTNYYFSGDKEKAATPEQFEFYKKVAEEYKQKATDDTPNAQLWTFCAAAAMNRATLNSAGFEEYAKTVILSIRQIVTNQMVCPCPRAIPPALWKKYKK
jgi:hypothetical protein